MDIKEDVPSIHTGDSVPEKDRSAAEPSLTLLPLGLLPFKHVEASKAMTLSGH